MDICPTCGRSSMTKLSYLLDDESLNCPHEADELGFVAWCRQCGTLVHFCNDGQVIYPILSKQRQSEITHTGPATDELGESWLKVEIPKNIEGVLLID